ncbi:hypothetical protein [Desulfatiglans anilini]|uniref:hypothetical protein n=1 Tax=Desulfatiglans anilini TaxID=90728 RepID=UPI000487084C|nr:hypothetical protein [Desulfatiglans anilini]
MEPFAPFSKPVLQQALEEISRDPAVVERLAWWSRHAHSTERWLQFELAFRLERLLGGVWYVGCERHYIDLVYYRSDAAIPLWSSEYAAGIELKWYANWWLKDEGAGFRDDEAKIATYRIPAAALAVCLVAWPRDTCRELSWIREAVKRADGARSIAEVRSLLTRQLRRPADFDFEIECLPHKDFESMRLLILGCYNDAARAPA